MPRTTFGLTRRVFAGGTFTIYSAFLSPPAWKAAFAQLAPSPIGLLSSTQKILLDQVLYKELPAYLAFDEVADAVNRKAVQGEEAANRFDAAYERFSRRLAEDNAAALDKAVGRGVVIDCMLTVSAVGPPISFSNLASPLFVPLGVAGSIARAIELQSGNASAVANQISDVLQGSPALTLVPIVPSALVGRFVEQRLKLLAGESGVVAVIGQATALVTKGSQLSAEFQSALSDVSKGIDTWSRGVGALASGSPTGSGSLTAGNIQVATSALSSAFERLGHAIGMNESTISDVSKSVNVAGSALAGAMAGSMLGPVGTAVGGVVGLVSGFLGSKSHGPDQSAQALARIDARIVQLTQAMQAGFNQLSTQMTAQLDALAQNMQSGFNALSNQIRALQEKTDATLARIEADIVAAAASELQRQINSVANTARIHEAQYRRFVARAPSNYLQSADEFKKAAWALAQTIETAQTGFSAPAFVGDVNFASYLASYSRALAGHKINLHLSPLMVMSSFAPDGVALDPPASLKAELQALSEQLQDSRYRLAGEYIRDDRYPAGFKYNASTIIHGIQAHCLAMLKGFEDAPESKGLGSRPEVRELITTAASAAAPAIAPEDLWLVVSSGQKATQQVSDVRLLADTLGDFAGSLRPHISRHYLLTGQNSLPALLYVRRRAAAALAQSCAIVFCNPYMAAIDVLRRVASLKMSREANRRLPRASQIEIADFSTAQEALQTYNRASMPLRDVTKVNVGALADGPLGNAFFIGSLSPGVKIVEDLVQKIFARTVVDPGVPPGASWSDYIQRAINYLHRTGVLTRPLVGAVGALTHDGGSPDQALGRHLKTIRLCCFLLGVIERRIEIRLEALKVLPNPGAVPSFNGWFEGFKEYGELAAYALGQAQQNDYAYAKGVMCAILGDPEFSVGNVSNIMSNDAIPEDLSDGARPYPVQLGQFWGWGAEQCRPDAPTDPALVAALLRPECALAGENGAVLSAAEAFSQIMVDQTLFGGSTDLIDFIHTSFPNGVKQMLRSELSAT